MPVLYCLVTFCTVLCFADAARILAVFPVPSISHQVVFRPLTQELARKGHEVTIITPNPAFPKGATPPNLKEIDVHDVSYKIWKEKFLSRPKGGKNDLMNQVKLFLDLSYAIADAQLSQEEVKKLINDENEKFDLLILESCVRSVLGFSHVFKVPVIQISSFGASYGNYEAIGAPIHPILYASIFSQRANNMTMWEKFTEIYNYYLTASVNKNFEKLEDIMLKKHFGEDIPPLAELSGNVDMLFLNVHPVFEGIRPVPPSVVYLGGLHQEPNKRLPADLKTMLDSSKHGVIYISFGTNVDTTMLAADKIEILVKVFSQLPYDILWKWDSKELPGRTKNIKISKWWPQSELLKHPNLKLFITQGGLQSTDEAITAGVPLIGIPMFGDQWFNVERYVSHKIGVKLDMAKLTEEVLRNAIQTIIGDYSYRKNIVNLRSVMYDQPMRPLERAVWWTEHVLRHGGAKHLRSPAANISWAQYLELELVLTILIILLLVISIDALAIYFSCKLLVCFIKIRKEECIKDE